MQPLPFFHNDVPDCSCNVDVLISTKCLLSSAPQVLGAVGIKTTVLSTRFDLTYSSALHDFHDNHTILKTSVDLTHPSIAPLVDRVDHADVLLQHECLLSGTPQLLGTVAIDTTVYSTMSILQAAVFLLIFMIIILF